MPDWPEPSPDDIEPSPEESLTPLCDSLRMQCHFTTEQWASIEVALKQSLRDSRRALRRFQRDNDKFFAAMARRNVRANVSALRALRNHKAVWLFDKQ